VTFIGFATFLFIFQYLQLVLGLSALEAALWAMPSFAAFIVSSMLTVRLVRLMRPAYVIGGGLTVTAAGLGLLVFADQDSGVALVVIASVVASIGEAPVFTLVNDLVLGAAPPERAGAASAISETSSELGGAFGIAILGSIGTALYRHQIADGIPEGVPPEDAAAARDTLGGAVAAGERLPEPLATELVDAGREAFIQGFHVAALTSAVIAAATAVVVVILLRRVRTGSESETVVDVGSDRTPVQATTPACEVGS
jgi:DHA2 family multidrug resistance protein-like MFS transporter